MHHGLRPNEAPCVVAAPSERKTLKKLGSFVSLVDQVRSSLVGLVIEEEAPPVLCQPDEHDEIALWGGTRYLPASAAEDGVAEEEQVEARPTTLDRLRRFARRCLLSQYFGTLFGCVIGANAITIGVELSYELEGWDTTVCHVLEHVYLSLYLLELGMRFLAFGWEALGTVWVKIDAVFVAIGVILSWIVEPLVLAGAGAQTISVLRMLRLLRLARAVQLLYKFKQLLILVQGLASSADTMFYTVTLTGAILYMFACIGVEVVRNHELVKEDEVFKKIVDTHFNSLPRTILTLLQFYAMDSCAAIYGPLVRKDWTLALYFIPVILVVYVVLSNLATAVIIDHALEQTRSNREALRLLAQRQRQEQIDQLHASCLILDTNGSDSVSASEFLAAALESPGSDCFEAFEYVRNLLECTDVEEVIQRLNLHKTESVNISDLCNDIYRSVHFEGPEQLLHIERMGIDMRSKVDEVDRLVDGVLAAIVKRSGLTPDVSARGADKLCGASLRESPFERHGPDIT